MAHGAEAKPVRLRGKSSTKATPYLRRWWNHVRPGGRSEVVIDLASGNGRNTAFVKQQGWPVLDLDMWHEEEGKVWSAGASIPFQSSTAGLVLCQYLLMFLSDREIQLLLQEIHRVLRPGGHVVFELQAVKSGRPVNLDRVAAYLQGYAAGVGPLGVHGRHVGGYKLLHFTKDRCVLRKIL